MLGRYTVSDYPSWEQCTAKKPQRRNTLLPVLYPSLDACDHPSRIRARYRLKTTSVPRDGHPRGCVANFVQEVVKGQIPLSVEGIRQPRRRTVRLQCGPRLP